MMKAKGRKRMDKFSYINIREYLVQEILVESEKLIYKRPSPIFLVQ